MLESPFIIQMNISHYEALLKTMQPAEQRDIIERLLVQARSALAEAADLAPDNQRLN